jgi:transcription antitermination factor NusG
VPDSSTLFRCSAAVPSVSQLRWFALKVKPNHEKSCGNWLASKGLETLVPVYRSRRRWSDRWKEVEVPLFSGYIFSMFQSSWRSMVLSVPGVRSIVTIGNKPTPVADHEIEAIRLMMASGLPVEPWPFLQVGQVVRIERGPLRGLEAILLRQRQHWRIVVSVEILQRSVSVEIERDAITPTRRFAEKTLVALGQSQGFSVNSFPRDRGTVSHP